jgi:hypothetical protein
MRPRLTRSLGRKLATIAAIGLALDLAIATAIFFLYL